ncbi:MAG: thiamine phosphate synthase [Gammaproteobacteria bacterium]|nr:thiamine phosphate synthase [Gammaproteobacteria bacterium]
MNADRLRGLYAITDERLMDENNFLIKAESALLGGARLIQYRDKSHHAEKRLRQASALKLLCQKNNCLLIINDDIALANAVQADGLHLGRDDAAIDQAREQLGEAAIIGVSCYDQIELATKAERAGANYVAFGAFFPSPTKPQAATASLDLLKTAKQQLQIPICGIGGITTDNAHLLIEQGADMTAIITDLFASHDIQKTASQITHLFS